MASTLNRENMNLKHELLNKENVGLAWQFRVSPHSCDNPDYYENYIRLSAISDANRGQAVTHVLLDTDKQRIAGYVALRTTSLVSNGEDGTQLVHPAVEVAELAVDADYERNDIGSHLVGLAILLAYEIRKQIGIRSILVCADPKAVGFYEKQHFEPLSNLYTMLRDGWNNNCIPMYIEFPEN